MEKNKGDGVKKDQTSVNILDTTKIFYYGQTSIRSSTLKNHMELNKVLRKSRMTNMVVLDIVNYNVLHVINNINDEDLSRHYRKVSYKYEERNRNYNDHSTASKIKNDIIDKINFNRIIIIHIPEYKSTGWVAVAILALFYKDKKDVYFVGAIRKIKYSSTLISESDYLAAGSINDIFTGNVYDNYGNRGLNIITKIPNTLN